jgi:ketosteroid isomerase-like protein
VPPPQLDDSFGEFMQAKASDDNPLFLTPEGAGNFGWYQGVVGVLVDGQLTKTQGPAPRAERIAGCQRINEQRLSATDDVQEEDVYVLGPDAAYIVTRSIYTVRLRDGRTRIRPQVATGIWSRQADGWRLVHFHESWREVEEQTTSLPKEGDAR